VLKALVVSDDGYESPGLWLVAETLVNMGFKTVAATTAKPSSAMSHSITLGKEMNLVIKRGQNLITVIVDGKPCDAFYAGLAITNENPEIVISGINLGENTSIQNSLYSSTIAVAIEAGMIGLKSIAISVDTYRAEDFRNVWLRKILTTIVKASVKWLIKHGMPIGVVALSINVPLIKSYGTVPGVKVTRMAKTRFRQRAKILNNKMEITSIETNIVPKTDTYEVKIRRNIAIVPLILCLDGVSSHERIDLESVFNFANYLSSSLKELTR